MADKIEQLRQMVEALEAIAGYQEKRARVSELNTLAKEYGRELAEIRNRHHQNPEDWARDAWLKREIAKLSEERSQLRAETDIIKDEIEKLRGRATDERRKTKREKAQGVRHAPKTVLDMNGEPILSVMMACPIVETGGPAIKYLNPNTDWANAPRLYFGMGGGSQRLTKGFALDAVSMVLVGEVLRRVMKLKECSVLCADVITRTNPFPLDQIQRVMEGERDIMRYLVGLFGFPNWKVVLHSELHQRRDGIEVDKETIFHTNPDDCRHPEYIRGLQVMFRHIDAGIARSPFAELGKDARGHEDNWHFALETALTEYLVGNGIHLGWYIPGPDIHDAAQVATLIAQYGQAGLKRMDEEPFDSYHEHTLAVAQKTGEWNRPNRISPVYCKAGIRIPTSTTYDQVERVPPYICYYPDRSILITDDPDEIRRKVGGDNGLWRFNPKGAISRYWRDFLHLAALLGLPCEGQDLVEGLCAFQGYLNRDGELRRMYARTFPDS